MYDSLVSYRDSNNRNMALLIRSNFHDSGIRFLTEDSEYMQVAYMAHPSGHVITPHFHNKIPRIIDFTCETLIVRRGQLKVDLYEDEKIRHTFEMKAGDIVTLFSGGHGFTVIDEVEMIEIKQGPFVGPEDKTRF